MYCGNESCRVVTGMEYFKIEAIITSSHDVVVDWNAKRKLLNNNILSIKQVNH